MIPSPIENQKSKIENRGTPTWLLLQEAADRSGQSVGNLRRKCGEVWMAQGLAKTDKYPTGQQGWYVRADADPSFAAIPSPEQLSLGVDLTSLSDAHRQQLLERRQILDGWESAVAGGIQLGLTKDQTTARYLARLQAEGKGGISRATLYGWRTAYRKDGIAGLTDDRRSIENRKSKMGRIPSSNTSPPSSSPRSN